MIKPKDIRVFVGDQELKPPPPDDLDIDREIEILQAKDNAARLYGENARLKSALNGMQSREALLDHLINYANNSRDSSVSVQYLQMIRIRGAT